jgi:outer membrane murein-binding lipoprotein Lpp
MKNALLVILSALSAVLTLGLVKTSNENRTLRSDVLLLRSEMESLREQLQAASSVKNRNGSPSETVASTRSSIAQSTEDKTELYRLRGRVSQLIVESGDLRQELSENARKERLEERLGRTNLKIATEGGASFAPLQYHPSELWMDVGAETPEAALQSFLSSARSGDVSRNLNLLDISDQQFKELTNRLTPEVLLQMDPFSGALGVKIDAAAGTPESGRMHFVTEFDKGEGSSPTRAHFYLVKRGDEWKVSEDITIEGE